MSQPKNTTAILSDELKELRSQVERESKLEPQYKSTILEAAKEEPDPNEKRLEGWLTKRGAIRKNLKRRWVILDQGKFQYYKEQPHEAKKAQKALGEFSVESTVVRFSQSAGQYGFEIETPNRTYFLYCDRDSDIFKWKGYLVRNGASFDPGLMSVVDDEGGISHRVSSRRDLEDLRRSQVVQEAATTYEQLNPTELIAELRKRDLTVLEIQDKVDRLQEQLERSIELADHLLDKNEKYQIDLGRAKELAVEYHDMLQDAGLLHSVADSFLLPKPDPPQDAAPRLDFVKNVEAQQEEEGLLRERKGPKEGT